MYKLLVADDESLIVRGVCRTLSRLGMFEIEWALNGKDAWEILERKQTDAMLLDINMPDIDGITLLKKLSEIGTGVETVIISGYEAFDYAQEALRYGAPDYLLKPLTPKDVEAVGVKLYERLEARKKEEEVNRQLREFVMQPVSYTHLDVYKRQVLYRGRARALWRRQPQLLRAHTPRREYRL